MKFINNTIVSSSNLDVDFRTSSLINDSLSDAIADMNQALKMLCDGFEKSGLGLLNNGINDVYLRTISERCNKLVADSFGKSSLTSFKEMLDNLSRNNEFLDCSKKNKWYLIFNI